MSHKLESRLQREISITTDRQMIPPLWQKVKEPINEGERGEWKSWLKTQHSKIEDHGIWSHHFMANGKAMETVTDFILLGSKITVDGECSHEIKRHFALWKKIYDKSRQHIKKQRHYFANKGPYSQTMVFPVVMYGCESWNVKKAECWRNDVFEVWCWRRLLRVPWTARRSTCPS